VNEFATPLLENAPNLGYFRNAGHRPRAPNSISIFLMSSLELIVIALVVLAILVIWLIWQNPNPHEIKARPVTQGTIQSVGTVVLRRSRSSYSVEVV
jgi:hypothetical protein